MNKICTSIDQSQKLIELGVDINTADMYWSLTNQNHPPVIGKYCAEYGGMQLPAWSLTALLELMPDVININGINYRQQEFKTKNSYCYCYADERFPISFDGQPVDAAFEMVVWLKENDKL